MAAYDAFLLVSFGGPEGPDDVIPFLENVTRGRGVPRERLEEVAGHYHSFGGVSPLNQQCRDLVAAIEKGFAGAAIDLPVYWGNRNWKPYLTDTVAAMTADGRQRAIAFVTAAYSSYSSCRQYLDDIEQARAAASAGGGTATQIDKLRHYFNHPGFIEPLADATQSAVDSLPAGVQSDFDLVFTAHSIPEAMAAASGPGGSGAYQAQLAEAARLVAERVTGARSWRLAYQSRSGPPAVPWLGPDVSDCLAGLARSGSRAAVLVPVGFTSDHMEVVHDLDMEAAQTAERLGLAMARAATPGTDRRFTAMIIDLVRERLEGAPRQALGSLGPFPDQCRDGCCPARAASPARGASAAASPASPAGAGG
jgi:protoporphyrin/coproporphyrin ferrochelatase